MKRFIIFLSILILFSYFYMRIFKLKGSDLQIEEIRENLEAPILVSKVVKKQANNNDILNKINTTQRIRPEVTKVNSDLPGRNDDLNPDDEVSSNIIGPQKSQYGHQDFLKEFSPSQMKLRLQSSLKSEGYSYADSYYFSDNYQGVINTNHGLYTMKLQIGSGRESEFADSDCMALYSDQNIVVYGSIQEGNFNVYRNKDPHHIIFNVGDYYVEGYAEFPHIDNEEKMAFKIYRKTERGFVFLGTPSLTPFPVGRRWSNICLDSDVISK